MGKRLDIREALHRPRLVGGDDEERFVEEWKKRSRPTNWNPGWNFRTEKRVVRVNWAEVADTRVLHRLSRLAERKYLRELLDKQQEWLRLKEASIGRSRALAMFTYHLAKTDLYYLAKYVLGYKDLNFHMHKGMAEVQQDLPLGFRGLREAQRGGFKSTIWTIAFCVQQILRNPNVAILIKSNNDENAARKLEETKGHFLDSNGPLGKISAALGLSLVPAGAKGAGSGSFWRCPAATRATTEGTLESGGVGTSKTGRHYDIIIGDDFWDQKSVTSLELTAKVVEDLAQLKYLLIDQTKGRIVFVGTRFAHDDPTETLSRSHHAVIIPGILPNGRPTFPERLPISTCIKQIKEDDGGIYAFSCQIMLAPTKEDQNFKAEWLNHYLRWSEIREEVEAGKLAIRLVMLTDAAADGKSTSDNVAIGTLCIDSKGRETLVGYVRSKMEPSRFIAEVSAQWDRWSPVCIARQKTALETSLQSFFREENKRREEEGKNKLIFYDYSLHKREKKARITASLQPRLQRGEIFFDPDLNGLEELRKEFLEHPNSRVDDGLDMLAMIDDPYLSRRPEAPEFVPPPPPEPKSPEDEDLLRRQDKARALIGYNETPGRRRQHGRVFYG